MPINVPKLMRVYAIGDASYIHAFGNRERGLPDIGRGRRYLMDILDTYPQMLDRYDYAVALLQGAHGHRTAKFLCYSAEPWSPVPDPEILAVGDDLHPVGVNPEGDEKCVAFVMGMENLWRQFSDGLEDYRANQPPAVTDVPEPQPESPRIIVADGLAAAILKRNRLTF